MDRNEIIKFLEFRKSLLGDGQFEIPALSASGRDMVGWITPETDVAAVAARIEDDGRNYYYSLNDSTRGWTGRTDAKSVCGIVLVLFDFDSPRFVEPDAKGHKIQCMADKTEKAIARKDAKHFLKTLQKSYNLKKNNFAIVDSGNGYQILLIVNLPYEPEKPNAIKTLLQFCQTTMSLSCLDLACSNPSRIARLPGTMNRKGVSTSERPHVMASILWLPSRPETFDLSPLLKDAIAWGEKNNTGRPSRPKTERKEVNPLRPAPEFKLSMEDYLIRYHPDLEWGGPDRCQCPFHGGDNPTSLWVSDTGAFCHACQSSWNLIGAIMADQRCSVSDAYRWAESEEIIERRSVLIPLNLDNLNN
jgi:hypothetical protein